MKHFDAIIIGAGPAGLTAAMYLSRANKSVAVFEKMTAGGKLAVTPVIENYPGSSTTDGWSIAEAMKKQAEDSGAQIIYDEIIKADLKALDVSTQNCQYASDVIIIATGSKSGKLGLEREEELVGNGVSYCAVCDGAFFKRKTVMLAGSGDRAFKDLKYLADICEKVIFVTPNAFDVQVNENVEVIDCAVPVFLSGTPLSAVEVERLGKKFSFDVCALFIDTAQTAETTAFRGQIKTDPAGFITVDSDMRTSLEHVFAAGDVCSKTLRQVVTAASDGAIAAASAVKDLAKRRKLSKKI